MGLQSFERALGNMVDSVFSRSSRTSTIRPVELGRRLLREMDDHRSVDVKGRRIVPNSFTFHLSARDHAGFADIEHALIHELGEAAREYARDEGYHFVGPVHVEIVVDNALKQGRFGIASALREGHVADPSEPVVAPAYAPEPVAVAPSPAPVEQSNFAVVEQPQVQSPWAPAPQAAPPAPAPAPMAPAAPSAPAAVTPTRIGSSVGRLQLPSGERVTVGHRVVTLGRLPECTVTLSDPNVSRRHAEIRPGAELTIVDLGSTNGTKVNGLRIDGERVLVDGDIISLGSSHLRFEASNASA
ncbi:MAG: FhaA domain-containing protein [Acidimicrobiales bacterium]